MASEELPPGAEIPPEFDFKLYRYTPSLAGAIVGVCIFAILTGAHVWRMTRARAFYFTPFVIGGACAYSPLMYPSMAAT